MEQDLDEMNRQKILESIVHHEVKQLESSNAMIGFYHYQMKLHYYRMYKRLMFEIYVKAYPKIAQFCKL
jgi:hypothetical protein